MGFHHGLLEQSRVIDETHLRSVVDARRSQYFISSEMKGGKVVDGCCCDWIELILGIAG